MILGTKMFVFAKSVSCQADFSTGVDLTIKTALTRKSTINIHCTWSTARR